MPFPRGRLGESGNNGSTLDEVTTGSILADSTDSYTLDSMGNWTDSTALGDETSNDQNQITSVSVGTTSPTYDNNGNMTTDQNGNSYSYDYWNRLENGEYNALGELVQSGSNYIYYSASGQEIEDRATSTGVVTNQYVWGEAYVNELVLRDDNSTSGSLGKTSSGLGRRLYAQQDANWNVTSLVGYNGTNWVVVERYIYDPYGNVTVLNADGTVHDGGAASASSYNWVYLYQDGKLDVGTGLYLFNIGGEGRNYDPTLGSWIEEDRAGYVDGANVYRFEVSNPANSLDPQGLDVIPGIIGPGFGSVGNGTDGIMGLNEIGFKAPPNFTGDLIQHVHVLIIIHDCSGNLIELTEHDYYEEWQITGGSFSDNTGGMDRFFLSYPPPNTYGDATFSGDSEYIPSPSNAPIIPLTSQSDTASGSLPSQANAPPGWRDGQTTNRSLHIWWDFCCRKHIINETSTGPISSSSTEPPSGTGL